MSNTQISDTLKIINILINNDELNTFNEKYKWVFSGVKALRDGFTLIDKLNITGNKRLLVLSLINNKRFERKFDITTIHDTIYDIMECKYREEAYDKIEQLTKITIDVAQMRTFMRIALSKPFRPKYIPIKQVKDNINDIIVTKKCPHCSHKCSSKKNTEYIICGFGDTGYSGKDTGYDWEGCNKDWCFKCGKILCKTWEADQLFLLFNRIHTNKCCKKHAQINNKKYPEDYCQCSNSSIRRDIN
jgi:hypothetical protein